MTLFARVGGRMVDFVFHFEKGNHMNRFASLWAVAVMLMGAGVADAQCCGSAVTTCYQPSTVYYAAAPATTVYYAAPTTTYYAPAATTAYYAAPQTVYYAAAPQTVYYSAPMVGAGVTRVGYAPVTYAYPTTTYYAPTAYYTSYSPWWW